MKNPLSRWWKACLLTAVSLLASLALQPLQAAPAVNIVRVNITSQAYDFSRPWSKKAPISKQALGAVLKGNRVLVTAECVTNATYIELETPEGDRKQAASVESVDYESNLALLRPEKDDSLLRDQPGLPLGSAKVGDSLAVWQLEANGNLIVSKGQMTTAEVNRYPLDDSAFLVYRISVPLQMRNAYATLPVLKDGHLSGLLLRYDSISSLLDIIPAPVIEHFLRDAQQKPYKGFPRLGLSFGVTRDPQLRRYLKIENLKGGVQITQTLQKGPADQAGIQKGDVLLEIAGQPIDADGNYADPDYGKISLGHLVSTKHFQGDSVPLKISRNGALLEKTARISHRPADQLLSPPYLFDRAPLYYILGGLVFQELSRTFLKEFGADWARKAPQDLVHLDAIQSEMEEDPRKRVVFLSRVLPSQVTIGYESLRFQAVRSINGVALQSLADLPKALTQAKDGVHRIEFTSEPFQIFVDAAGAEQSIPDLQRSYRIPAMQRLE